MNWLYLNTKNILKSVKYITLYCAYIVNIIKSYLNDKILL